MLYSRETPASDPAAVFTDEERHLLECATPDRMRQASHDLAFYARLGGYIDRTSDPPPGTTVIWRGLSRLSDLLEGARMAKPPPETYG
ncbi:IS4 family transposase [Pseudogemmobacter faecipullorum]|uniref:IS4 family transposase n=1 Tax=Pseudogemmobacter faecipullorum TaxID=2755041 RepID=UPI001D012B29